MNDVAHVEPTGDEQFGPQEADVHEVLSAIHFSAARPGKK